MATAGLNHDIREVPNWYTNKAKKKSRSSTSTHRGRPSATSPSTRPAGLVMCTSSETPGEYGKDLVGVRMAFEVAGIEETEDHYVMTLSFRPQGRFAGTPGQEQFFIEKEGAIAYRQVLSLPEVERRRRFPVVPVLIAVVLIAIVGGVGAVFASGALGGGRDDTTAVPGVAVASTATPTPTVAEPAVASAQVTAAEIQALVEAAVAAAAAQGASAEEIEALATLEVEQAAAEAAIPLSASELESIAAAALVAAVSVPDPTVAIAGASAADMEALVEFAVELAAAGAQAVQIREEVEKYALDEVGPYASERIRARSHRCSGHRGNRHACASSHGSTSAVAVATVAPVAVIAQATAAAPAVQVVQARGTLNYYHPVRWGGEESLDPAVRQRWEPITEVVYDRLIRLNRGGQPIPRVAESWEVNSDATSWTFNIRNGVTFSDGRPLTAKDAPSLHLTMGQHYLNPDEPHLDWHRNGAL